MIDEGDLLDVAAVTAQTKIISQIVKKNVIENIIPVVIATKHLVCVWAGSWGVACHMTIYVHVYSRKIQNKNYTCVVYSCKIHFERDIHAMCVH